MWMIMSMMMKPFIWDITPPNATPWAVVIAQATNTHMIWMAGLYTTDSWSVKQQIQLNYSGTFTINWSSSWFVWASWVYYSFSRLYKNWSPIGTQFNNSIATSQDIACITWDIISLYSGIYGTYSGAPYIEYTVWNLTISAAVAQSGWATILLN